MLDLAFKPSGTQEDRRLKTQGIGIAVLCSSTKRGSHAIFLMPLVVIITSLLFLFKDQPFVSVFSRREFFADEEMFLHLMHLPMHFKNMFLHSMSPLSAVKW